MLQKIPEPSPSLATKVADSKKLGCAINLLLIPFLIILALLLPPISLPERIFDAGYRTISKNGGDLKEPDGALLSISPKGMEIIGSTKVKFSSVSAKTFLDGKAGDELTKALNAFPPNLDLRSPIYQIALKGNSPNDAFFSVETPTDAEPYNTLDFYAWDGTRWEYIAGRFYPDDQAEASLSTLPRALAIVQTKATPPTISAEMATAVEIPKEGADALAEVNPLGLVIKDDGLLIGQMLSVPPSQNYIIVPTLSNVQDNIARSDFVTNMLVNDKIRHAHVQSISDLTVQNLLPGVDINYAGLKPELRDYFTKFIKELSDELHSRGKLLTVSVPLPAQLSDEEYDTGAYDWVALGQMVDGLKIPSMTTANAYKPDGAMERLLNWAVARVSRYKIQLALDTMVQDRVNSQLTTRSYDDAFKALVGKIKVDGLAESYATPLQDVKLNVNVASGFNGFNRDDSTRAYVYNYKDEDGNNHTVYLETADSLTFKMALAGRYRLKGVAFRGLLGTNTDPNVWKAIAQYRQSVDSKTNTSYELVWTVTDGKGQQIQVEKRPLTGADTSFTWKAAPVPDQYTIGASISTNGAPATGDTVAIAVAIPTATPTPLPTATPVPQPTAVPVAAQPRPTSPPRNNPPVAAAPGFFGYGIQVDPGKDINTAVGQTKQLGFGWVKAQVPYGYFYPGPGRFDFSMMDRVVNAASAQGLRVLFSIVKAPKWSRPPGDTDEGPPADPNTYADFVRAVADRYKGKGMAYEIWNEENLYYEWGGLGNKLSAARYMEILRVAYAAIKSVDPDAIVISGAPTPTGADDGNIGINDQKYLQQLYSLGVKNYSDAIGAHPSGFNCPADGDWRAVANPGARFRGPFDNHHPSWCFRGTIEGYRNIMVANGDGNKRIWATEFGWASVDGLGVKPAAGYEYAADNSAAQQADWLVQAYQIGKTSGYMGVMFMWNLNYNNPPGDEKSAFSITTATGAPRPAFAALANMPK